MFCFLWPREEKNYTKKEKRERNKKTMAAASLNLVFLSETAAILRFLLFII